MFAQEGLVRHDIRDKTHNFASMCQPIDVSEPMVTMATLAEAMAVGIAFHTLNTCTIKFNLFNILLHVSLTQQFGGRE